MSASWLVFPGPTAELPTVSWGSSERERIEWLESWRASDGWMEVCGNCGRFSLPSRSTVSMASSNETSSELDLLEFNGRLLLNVIAYSLMCLLGTALNLCVFMAARRHHRRSGGSNNVHLMVLHLTVADLCVCGCVMPIEVVWRLSVQWYVGNVLCKAAMFVRAFAFYLSSTTLVCLSLDRYWAVSRPLRWSRSQGSARRTRRLIALAWLASTLFALPQTLVFRVRRHPKVDFKQCTSMHFFDELLANSSFLRPESVEMAHKALFLLAVYLVPLAVIVVSYANIVAILLRRQRRHRDNDDMGIREPRFYSFRGRMCGRELRRNNVQIEQSGRMRRGLRASRSENMALRMSVTHVLAFIACWTPYLVISLWHMVDAAGLTSSLSPEVQDVLFLTAVCNSCINPVVYGLFYVSKEKHSSHNESLRTTRMRLMCVQQNETPSMLRSRGEQTQGGLDIEVDHHQDNNLRTSL